MTFNLEAFDPDEVLPQNARLITAAMLGYTRRGSGWVKRQNRNS